MARDPRYDILFEPVRIGPIVARNRFYQVPHCNGMGWRDPSALAAMRGIKAEGGWAVVCTEMTEIHPTADVAPYVELRIWSDQDIPMHARIAEKIHENDSLLAGIELCYSGYTSSNLWSREIPVAPTGMPTSSSYNSPIQARTMDKEDIKIFAAPIAPQHFAPAPPVMISSTSMPGTASAFSSSSSRAPPIGGATNMAAPLKTGPVCFARLLGIPRKPLAIVAPFPSALP